MTVNGKYIGTEHYITRLLGDGGDQILTPELQRLVDSMADDGEALIITGVDEEQLITSKSPRRVLLTAYHVGKDALPQYWWEGASKMPARGLGEGRGKYLHWIAGLSAGLPWAAGL